MRTEVPGPESKKLINEMETIHVLYIFLIFLALKSCHFSKQLQSNFLRIMKNLLEIIWWMQMEIIYWYYFLIIFYKLFEKFPGCLYPNFFSPAWIQSSRIDWNCKRESIFGRFDNFTLIRKGWCFCGQFLRIFPFFLFFYLVDKYGKIRKFAKIVRGCLGWQLFPKKFEK